MSKPDIFQYGKKCALFHNGCESTNVIMVLYCKKHRREGFYCPLLVDLKMKSTRRNLL